MDMIALLKYLKICCIEEGQGKFSFIPDYAKSEIMNLSYKKSSLSVELIIQRNKDSSLLEVFKKG